MIFLVRQFYPISIQITKVKQIIMDNQTSSVVVNFSPELQQILDNRIGYGKAQWKLITPISFLILSEGAQTIAIGLLLPILKQQYHLTTFEQALGLTIISIGMPLGSFLQGFSDNYGRSPFIMIDSVILLVFGLLSTVSWNFAAFVAIRFFYEIGIGICLPLTSSFTSEIAPAKERGTLLARLWIIWVGGYLVSCALGYFLLTRNQWRLVLLILCIPSALGLIAYFFLGRETLHYLWVKKEIAKSHELINEMCLDNGRALITLQAVQTAIEEDIPSDDPNAVPMSELFNQKLRPLTLRLMIPWLAGYFIYYGITLLLPTILRSIFSHSSGTRGFEYFYLAGLSIIEIMCTFVAPFIMNHPLIGSRRTIYTGMAICFVSSVLIMIFGKNLMVLFVLMAIIKAANSVHVLVIYVYTAQLYETLLRSKAEGICPLVGRTSVALLGIVGLPAIHWLNGTGLYLIFAVISAAGFYATYTIPVRTSSAKV